MVKMGVWEMSKINPEELKKMMIEQNSLEQIFLVGVLDAPLTSCPWEDLFPLPQALHWKPGFPKREIKARGNEG